MPDVVFSGVGKAFIASRLSTGQPGPFRDLGNLDEKGVSVELATELFNVMSTSDSARGLFARLPQAKTATLNFSLDIWNRQNLALQLLGLDLTIASGSVATGSPETLPTVAVGDFVALKNPDVSSVVIKDSAGTPATLTAGTHYEVTDAKFGRIKILDLTTLVQPLKASYSYGAAVAVPMLTQNPPEKVLRFELLNTADSDRKHIVELYRVQFDPVKTLNLIQMQGIHVADFSPAILLDTTKSADPNSSLGQYGRVIMLDQAA